MTVTKSDCEKSKAEIKDHTSQKIFELNNNFQSYMEKQINKISSHLEKIEEKLSGVVRWKERVMGALAVIMLIVVPSSIYLVKDFLNSKHEAMTEKDVQEVVELYIESNYTAEWQND